VEKNGYKRYWTQLLIVLQEVNFADNDNASLLSHDERNCRATVSGIFRDYDPNLLYIDGLSVYESDDGNAALAVIFGERCILCTPIEEGGSTLWSMCTYEEIPKQSLPFWFRNGEYSEKWDL